MNDSSLPGEARQAFRTWEADVMFWQTAGQLQLRRFSHPNKQEVSSVAAQQFPADEAMMFRQDPGGKMQKRHMLITMPSLGCMWLL